MLRCVAPHPSLEGVSARVRAEHVSWLEAAVLAFPALGMGRVPVAEPEHAGSVGALTWASRRLRGASLRASYSGGAAPA